MDFVTAAKAKYEDEGGAADEADAVMCVKRPALNTIREVVLVSAGISSVGDFASIVAAVRVLDLSGNGLSSWADASALISGLGSLVSLDLSRNPLGAATALDCKPASSSLKTLQLNETGLNWGIAAAAIAQVPTLTELGLSGNALADPTESDLPVASASVATLWLGNNALTSWSSLQSTVGTWPALTSLMVMANPIVSVAQAADGPSFATLAALSLSQCPIQGWESVEALANLPALRDLRLYEVPFMAIYAEDARRMLVIARLKNLSAGGKGRQTVGSETAGLLNRGPITANEREDAVRFFESFVEPTEEEAAANKEANEKSSTAQLNSGTSFTNQGLGRCE